MAAAGLGAGYAWTRTQYFVGAAGDQVAIYQGLPDGIPGLQLSQVYEVQDLPVASLPPYYQAQVTRRHRGGERGCRPGHDRAS